MSRVDTSRAISVASATEFDDWLAVHGGVERDAVVAIHRKASGRQTVTLEALQETALCHGWVDTQTRHLDDERYAIRFMPRRSGSHWSPKNREMARRLRAQGRVRPAGIATLPPDL